jgi:hypothetical protein
MVSSAAFGSTANLHSIWQSTNQTQPLSALTGSKADRTSEGVYRLGSGQRDSAQISGPGKLYSQLQQLQAHDPAKFKQVVANIAAKLQASAKQQGQTPEGQFLAQLANKFQAVANSGSLAPLQPQQAGRSSYQTYTPSGQLASQSAVLAIPNQAGQGFPSSDVQQLFAEISKEVSRALGS